MIKGLAVGLVNGANDFVAVRLAFELIEKGLFVAAVGEDMGDLRKLAKSGGSIAIFESLSELKNYEIEYGFDFKQESEFWELVKDKKIRSIGVCVDKDFSSEYRNKAKENEDWRLIKGEEIFGIGMDLGSNVIGRIIKDAADNSILKFPGGKNGWRCAYSKDFVEAIFRATFFSGTGGEEYVFGGEEHKYDDLFRTIVNMAKMTRRDFVLKTESKVLNEEEIVETREKLRLDKDESFEEGMKATIQYGLREKDRKNRGDEKTEDKKILKRDEVDPVMTVEVEKPKREKKYEVMVEEEGDKGNGGGLVEMEGEFDSEVVEERVEGKEGRKEDSEIASKVNDDMDENEEVLEIEEETETREQEEKVEEIRKKFKVSQVVKKPVDQERGYKQEEDEDDEIAKAIVIKKKELEEKIFNSRLARVKEEKKTKKIDIKGIGGKVFQVLKKFSWLSKVILVAMVVSVVGFWITFGIVKRNAEAFFEQAEKLRVEIGNKDWDEARKIVANEKERLRRFEKISETIDSKGKILGKAREGMRAMDLMFDIGSETIDLALEGEKLGKMVLNDEDGDVGLLLNSIEVRLEKLENKSGLLAARLSGNWRWLPAPIRSKQVEWMGELNKARELVSKARAAIRPYISMTGVNESGKKNYLVLFENENELRPGGGFIGSYGVLTFAEGKLQGLNVGDVYEIDGQLKGHVEPPEEIRKYLGEGGWYLRDSNWDADFGDNSRKVQWFFEKETGRQVDGVISFNLAAARQFVKVAKEVYIADYKTTVTADNLYDQAQFHAEKNFFGGSTQKQNFLGLLAANLFDKVKSFGPEEEMNLVNVLIDSLEKNEIQISVNSGEAKSELRELGWDGEMEDVKCGKEGCFQDFTYIVEANLGVNKANYFLYRSIEELVEISTDSVIRTLKVNYENSSKDQVWPGGDYKNYFRVYLPGDIEIVEANFFDSGSTKNKKSIKNELKLASYKGRKEIGWWMKVGAGEKKTIEIKYRSKSNLSEKSDFLYSKYFQKQSGFGETPVSLMVVFDEKWKALQAQPSATAVGNKVMFKQSLEKDLSIGVEIGR